MKHLIKTFYIALLFSLLLGGVYFSANDLFAGKQREELNIFVWGDFFDYETIEQFEEETGIKVNLNFYTSNEEMLAKFRLTRGGGYDLLFPSDYAAQIMAKEGLLQEINKERVEAYDQIDPLLLGHTYDPENRHALPYIWEAYGFFQDCDELSERTFSLDDAFDPKKMPHKFVMTPDAIEASVFCAYYLYKKPKDLQPSQIRKIQQTLKSQKNSIEAYADFRAKDLITTGNAELALLKTSYIDAVEDHDYHTRFTLPSDFVFTSIENVVITRQCQNLDAAYKFINFIYQPEYMAQTINQCPLYPSIVETFDYAEDHSARYYDIHQEIHSRKKDLRFFSYLMQPDLVREIWIETKSK